MFIEVHDKNGHAMLICVDDIQRVRRHSGGGSEIFLNEHDEEIRVQESVPAIKDLIVKAGGLVAAAAKIEGSLAPIRLQTVETPRDKD